MLTFALGAACAGVGGTLIGAAFQFGPSSGAAYLLNSLAIVVLGGLGNVLGTLVGGLVLGFLQSLGGLTLGDGYRDLVGMALFPARAGLPSRRLSRAREAIMKPAVTSPRPSVANAGAYGELAVFLAAFAAAVVRARISRATTGCKSPFAC